MLNHSKIIKTVISLQCLNNTSRLKIYGFKNKVGSMKSTDTRNDGILQWENPYFGIYYSKAQWATLTCYKLLNGKVGIFSP